MIVLGERILFRFEGGIEYWGYEFRVRGCDIMFDGLLGFGVFGRWKREEFVSRGFGIFFLVFYDLLLYERFYMLLL